MQISVFIIAKNEGDRIRRTLESVLEISDDIVLVDSGSSDDTTSIAESMGARVVHNEWTGYGNQKRFAEDCCRNDWVFNLDADEVASRELREEILGLLKAHEKDDLPADAYYVRIFDVIPGDDRPRPLAYHHNYIRLYDRRAARFSPSPVHDTVAVKPGATCGALKGAVHHYSIRSVRDQIEKFNAYTDAQVEDLIGRNSAIPTWRLFLEMPMSFCKAFFFRRYFMQGIYGFISATNYSICRYLRVAKFYERRSGRERRVISR